MATKTIEAELLDLEKRYWQAIKDQDVDAAMRLTDEPCILTGAQGIGLMDRRTLTAMTQATSYTLNHFVLKDGAQVRLLRTAAGSAPCIPRRSQGIRSDATGSGPRETRD